MKTILITGGSKGIGFSTAEKCLNEGCRVILIARDLQGLEKAKQQLMSKGAAVDRIRLYACDMGDLEQIPQMIQSIDWIREGLHGLVNNAAIEILGKTKDFSLKEMEKMIRVNCFAPVVMIQACWEALVRVKGSVVNIGSVADERYHEIYGIYGGSKGFLRVFTKHLAQELGFQGVKVNLVSPGGIQTPLMDEIALKHFNASDIEATLKTIPMEQRWGHSHEVAEAIWFALFGSRYFHGDDIRIHGGIAS